MDKEELIDFFDRHSFETVFFEFSLEDAYQLVGALMFMDIAHTMASETRNPIKSFVEQYKHQVTIYEDSIVILNAIDFMRKMLMDEIYGGKG